MRLTERDQQILRALTRCVRLFSLEQIASHWWCSAKQPTTLASARLSLLEQAGLVRALKVLARALPDIHAPLIVWEPTGNAPEFGKVAYRLKARWSSPAVLTPVYILGPVGERLLGARPKNTLKYRLQATHDLGVAQMYLTFCKNRLAEAQAWLGEDVLGRAEPGKIADAILTTRADRRAQKLLEFGGDYDTQRVRAFHRFAASQQLPYELW